VVVSGIGCGSKIIDYLNLNTFSSLHGRPIISAEGIKLGNKKTAGLITYLRTDSLNLSEEFLKESQEMIAKKYGSEYLEIRHYKTNLRPVKKPTKPFALHLYSEVPKKSNHI